MKEYFELGRILKPQGVRGEVKAELYTDDMDRVYDLPYVLMGTPSDLHKVKVSSARSDGRFAYLALEGVPDRNAAEALRDTILYIDRQNAAPLPEGAYYISDLIGLEVLTSDGQRLGVLNDVLQTGTTDVYVIRKTDGTEIMFPGVHDVFVERDPQAGRIVLNADRLKEIAEI